MAVPKLGIYFMPLVDGKRTMQQIFEACSECKLAGWATFQRDAQTVLGGLISCGQAIFSETTNRRLIPVEHY